MEIQNSKIESPQAELRRSVIELWISLNQLWSLINELWNFMIRQVSWKAMEVMEKWTDDWTLETLSPLGVDCAILLEKKKHS